MNDEELEALALSFNLLGHKRDDALTQLARKQVRAMLRMVRDQEREACAKRAEAEGTWVHPHSYEAQVDLRARIAAAIRARSEV